MKRSIFVTLLGLIAASIAYDAAMWQLHRRMVRRMLPFRSIWGGMGIALVLPFGAALAGILDGSWKAAERWFLVAVVTFGAAAPAVVIGNVYRDTEAPNK